MGSLLGARVGKTAGATAVASVVTALLIAAVAWPGWLAAEGGPTSPAAAPARTEPSAIRMEPSATRMEPSATRMEGAPDVRANAIAEDTATRRLLQAASRGQLQAVRAALDAGARIDENRDAFTGNASGQTALVAAALRGYDRVVRLLLERGADPTIPEKDGFTVWHAAAFQGRTDVLAVLDELAVPGYDLSPADGNTPLHRAAWGRSLRHVRAVRYLVGPSGRACDVRSRDGKTPAEVAKHPESRALLEACLARRGGEGDASSVPRPTKENPS